jgi:hypothetical protein
MKIHVSNPDWWKSWRWLKWSAVVRRQLNESKMKMRSLCGLDLMEDRVHAKAALAYAQSGDKGLASI